MGIGALRRMEALGFNLIFQARLTHPTILVLLTYIRSDRTTTTIHGVGIGALRRMEALGFNLIFQVRLTHPTILVLLTYIRSDRTKLIASL